MPAYQINWSYNGENGPEHWGQICSEFEIAEVGEKQSPINIKQQEVTALTGNPLTLSHSEIQYTVKRIENSVHLFPQEPNQTLELNGDIYTLVAFHAHIPSEHLLDGKTHPIEWHFVHENSRGEKLVLGAFMDVGTGVSIDMTELRRVFPEVFQDFSVEREVSLNIADFLPEEKAYYTYEGSLTTPPTVEGVRWVLLKDRQTIGHVAHKAFEKVIGGTNRPVQPLNNREIKFYE
ncbi:hypothetical protein MFLO_12341 [Listeria floridensis FSL S10-1187]|uniref:carbonic anhydrase n=1 Tax=Listeria floridensis FSL S10-1187 TaxID=1265817 RepID=A0ABN0RDE5_9LIST|nr:carbonic anhydrase family protein [Listeria floridensis]EUJ28528.1 hypothetical protein MFLO_12341 [Listeria floridensis FSL S10-1187]